jgi:phosphodiesterase/alkaline phosphatase D-like protein
MRSFLESTMLFKWRFMRSSQTRQAPPARRWKARLAVELLEDRLNPSVSFLAVGAGDASSSDVILWTRAQNSSTAAGVGLMAQVSTDSTFATGLATFAGITDPAHDYTIHVDATGLKSGNRYFYRFVANDNTISQVGTFVTAPDPTAKVPVSIGFSGDADGLMRPYDASSSPNFAPPGSQNFGSQNFDYFVWLGDTIYETASGGTGPNASPAVSNTNPPIISQYWAKYRQQFIPVNPSGFPGLTNYFDSNGHYTLLDNHELGNKQFINGGAPQGSPAGAGADATNPANDVNNTGSFMNQTVGYQTLIQAYTDYQPIRQQTVVAPNDPRSNGTQQLYFSQQWGANNIFFNLDDRSYRDIRMKTSGGADDTGVRADNPNRTMLGATEFAWIEQGLLAAQQQGIVWKVVALSSPIDQLGPIGGSITINNSTDANTTQPGFSTTESDGGKSWMGEYRRERNAFLKFIADNHIDHVVFLSTDDHLFRVNEVGYFTQLDSNGTPVQSSYTRVPGAFEIIAGPIGATGPDTITDHSFANIQALAQSFATQQSAMGIDPIGLDAAFPGLKNVSREGDSTAGTSPKPFDFYSPDTFNYVTLNVSADGSTLTVGDKGINSYATNSFPEPNANNAVRNIAQFQISLDPVNIAVNPTTVTAGGTTSLSATLTDASTTSPLTIRTLIFSVNGKDVGTASTNGSGIATLPGVSLAGILPGHYATGVSVRYLGDVSDLPGSGSSSLDILPATQVDTQVHFHIDHPSTMQKSVQDPVAVSAELTIKNKKQSTPTGLFAIVLANLTPGVSLQSATVMVQGTPRDLTITHNAAGDPIINIPKGVSTGLGPNQSLPTISLVFSVSHHKGIQFDTEVFVDPLA